MHSPRHARLTTLFAGLMSRRRSLRVLAASLLLGAGGQTDAVAASHPVRGVQDRAAKRRQRQHHRLKQRRRTQRHQNSGGPGDRAPGEIPNLVQWAVENRTAAPIGAAWWWFDQYHYKDNPRPWSPLKDATVPPGGTASDRLAINVFGVEFGYSKLFCEFVHHRNDGPRQPLDARVYVDGKMDRMGYRAGTVVFDQAIGEGSQATVVVRDWTLTLVHEPDLPNEARVRVIVT